MSFSVQLKNDKGPFAVVEQINYLFKAEINLIDEEINSINSDILKLDRLKNKLLPPKIELVKKYMAPKIEPHQSIVQDMNILSLESNIHAVLQNAEHELVNSQVNPDKLRPNLQIQSMYDDYQPAVMIKANLDPYKKQPNKMIQKGKAPAPPQKQKINYPIVPQRRSSMQKNPSKIGNQPAPNRSNSIVKISTPLQPAIQEEFDNKSDLQIKTKQSKMVQVEQPKLASPKNQQTQQKQIPLVTTIHSQPIKQAKMESEKINLANFSQTNYSAILDIAGQKDIQILSKLKLMKEQLFIEYNRNLKYYHEKEGKARNKFLDKFNSHSTAKQKVLNDQFEISEKRKRIQQKQAEVEEEVFIFSKINSSTLNDKVSLIHIELNNIQQIGYGLLQYCNVIGSYLQLFVEKFDTKLLSVLRKTNKNSIQSLPVKDLFEIFKIWSLIQFLGQNCNDLSKHVEHNNANQNKLQNQDISEYIRSFILKNIKLTKQDNQAVDNTKDQTLLSLNFDLKSMVFNKSSLQTTASLRTISIYKMLKINVVILQIFKIGLYPIIWDGLLPILKNQVSKKDLQIFFSLLSLLLSSVHFNGRTKVSFYGREDINQFI